ncbi:MAG: M28 family peptidase [Planctomycetes bacterium]|nr:M28 family peptidase [Planctomycetota bacterium]
MPPIVTILFSSIAFLAPPQTTSAPAAPEVVPPKSGNITPEEMRDLLYVLASDDFGGRCSGDASGRKAGDFIADQLKLRGVQPAGDAGTYFQSFSQGGGDGDGSYRNIVGKIAGTDPKLRDQYVVVGAHYDHCGKGDPGTGPMGNAGEIHHGADDNGSGTTTVLSIARVIAAKPLPRSTLFILFDAEERGLWGSEHFVKKPLVPLDKIQVMLNIDMVGRSYGGYLFAGGLGSANQLDDILTKSLKGEAKFLTNIERSNDSEGRSDQHNFILKKVPAMFFFSKMHRDYHQPRDTADKIQYKPMASIARAILEILKISATMKDRLEFHPVGANGMPKGDAAMEKEVVDIARATKRRLGGQIHATPEGKPAFADTEPAGVRAGFEKGDVILAIAKGNTKNPKDFKEVKSVEELRVECEKFKPGDAIQLKIQRDGKPLTIPTTIGDIPEWKYGPDKDGGDMPPPPKPKGKA